MAMICALLGAAIARAQTPAAPAPAPTIRNSTQVPSAPIKAGDNKGDTGEYPLNTPAEQPATDATPAGSPVAPGAHAAYFLPGTALQLRLNQAVDSGHQRNGDSIQGTLIAPVKAANGKVLPKGTPVVATIVSSAAAGTMQSYGVLSLQVYRVGRVAVFSNVLDFDGQEGHKDLADSAPEKGTEAAVRQGTVLNFKVLGAGDNPDPTEHGGRGAGGGRGGQRGADATSGQGAPNVGNTPTPQATTPAPGAQTPH